MLSESLWKVLSFILVIILMILFPILHLYEKQDEIIYYRIVDYTNEFVNTVKYSGYVDSDMWNEFFDKVNSLGYMFDIEITHKSGENVPLYENPQDLNTFEGDTKRVYILNSHQDIMDVLFPKKKGIPSSEKVYRMKIGDFIIVHVKALNRSKADVLRNAFLNADIESTFDIRFSGMIMQ